MENGEEKDLIDSKEQEKWEQGNYYGENPRRMTGVRAEKWAAAKANLRPPTSIRLQDEIENGLKEEAAQRGLSYQSLIRMVLTEYIKRKSKSA